MSSGKKQEKGKRDEIRAGLNFKYQLS
uniref:Uncharacterized protein n=1 Tax=Anguilla anguilla TaxID=7936 RepID=A0A0E9QDZ4_ANGAN